MAEKDADAPKTPTAQSLDRKIVQPPSPDVHQFPSAVSTPVSPSDLVAMENLRKKASAGIGGDRPGRYGEGRSCFQHCMRATTSARSKVSLCVCVSCGAHIYHSTPRLSLFYRNA